MAEESDEIRTRLVFVPALGWSVLHHLRDEKGILDGVISVGLFGFWMDPVTGVVYFFQTARGREPGIQALLGPDGEVTLNGAIWPSVDAYGEWAKTNCQ